MFGIVAKAGFVFVSLAISFCGMTLGSLIAETAYVLAYGNEPDAEFSTTMFKILVGIFLFVGMPIILYAIKTAELFFQTEFSKPVTYLASLGLLMAAVAVLAGRAFDYEWIILFATVAAVWLIYSETIAWLWMAPRRTLATFAGALVAVVAAVMVPRLLHFLDVQPDWARHAAAAVVLLMTLLACGALTIAVDRRKAHRSLWQAPPRRSGLTTC